MSAMKKIVSLVDRGAFDDTVYPQNTKTTVFQPTFKPYHSFTTNIVTWPFTGVAEWGKRITFTVPYPWETDMLSWVALRIKPFHWLDPDVYNHLYGTQDWTYINPTDEWTWIRSLGASVIAKAEMEIDGVIVEQWSGDWCNVWNRVALDSNKSIGWQDSVIGPQGGTEDGYVYCYLPFWFSKWKNTAFPLISAKGPVRFHITLRPFSEVVRKVSGFKGCEDTPLGSTFQVRDWAFPFYKKRSVTTTLAVPTMQSAELVCGIAHIDGPIRMEFRDQPHEIMMNPVQEIRFAEPLKYVIGKPTGERITIGLPLPEANGPIRQILWFLRRKAAVQQSDWTNYSGTLESDVDPVWNPTEPLMTKAQLMVGTAVWVDQDESWWRSQGALPLAGGIRAYSSYIYVYNFTEKPNEFDPAGSVNASRVDIRLNLEVQQPRQSSDPNTEWEVVVFLVGTNWMRFQNGLSNPLFMD
jgi:hypothetical protein